MIFFKKRKYLETEKVYEALDYAGCNGVHMVNLSADGEALLDERLPDFIK
ncbi:hypothetical protein [Helicobacter apodemus]|nr:hypothetical protein [Helicobacter apodemus]